MPPSPKPATPPGPVAAGGVEMLPVAVETLSKPEAVLTHVPERPIDPNAPPAGIAVEMATSPPPRVSPAADAHDFLTYDAANATHTEPPEFSAPDLSSGQGEAVVTETTEVQPPTGTTSVVSEHPVTVSPASPPEAASSTNAPQAPGAARGEAQPANAATPEPAQPPPETATEAQAPTVEATNATVPPHVETAEQTQQINGVLLEINKLLFEIGDANIAFTTLAAKAKGTLPLGAELRRQVLEGVRRELESKGKTLGPLDKNKKTISDAIKKINDIYAPDAPQIEPKDSALVEFLNKNKATLEQALPEKFDANGLITKVEAGDMSFAEALQIIFSEKAEETKAFRRTLAQALTGATGVPQLGYEDVLKTAGQQVTERNVARLKTAFQAVEKVNWMKRGLTFGGIALVLLMALAPMMMEGQGQGGGHG